ncbi:MAG: 3-hydroxyacyl-CoA dehydrogenase family protein [Candidatus Lokiarchaeota archaeon]|nr:3-hydroxyacyl-CoA dehydrogenase family protein [Candidatus Lokiarchaeota archaeon]
MVNIDNIRNIAIIGGGIMGSGIAQVALLSGYEKVTVIDLSSEILKKSRELIQSRMEALESEEKYKAFFASNEMLINLDIKKKLRSFESVGLVANMVDTKTIISRLYTETEISKGVKDADFVIEAVSEKLELKQNIFKQLGELTPPHAILASNTSSMSITKIAQFTNRPEKVIGMHFHTFFPITGKLIEITPGEKSSEESLEIGQTIAQNFPCLTGKRFTVRLEKETTGLIANRISFPIFLYSNWFSDHAIASGISREQLDAAGFSLEIADRIGLDTIYNIQKYLEKYLSHDFAPREELAKLVNEGRLGKKVGKGYYDWDENEPIKNLPSLDPKTTEFLVKNFDVEIIEALKLNEGCRLLEEGVVKSYRLIDKVLFKGNLTPGPFRTGKDKYKEWVKLLYTVVEKTGKSYLKPCEMMESGKFLTLR